MIFDFAREFAATLTAIPREHFKHRTLELLEEAIRREIHCIDRHLTTLFQCIWNTEWYYDCPDTVPHYDGYDVEDVW
jgi:hypothetical protein